MAIANMLLLLHAAFILFVLFGGLFVLKWPRLVWLHLPAVLWGIIVEAAGLVCPLTPLENRFLLQAGRAGYEGDFIARYLWPLIYPDGLTEGVRLALAGIVVILNGVIYFIIYKREVNHDPADRK